MITVRILAAAVLVAALAAIAPAHDEPKQQSQMRKMQIDPDKAVIVPEIGMVVTEKEGKLAVEFIPPADRRPKETASLDIAAGDEVGMAMGKKVTTAKELRAAYESAKPGDEVKVGLRRDGKAYIATFKKLDEKDMPKTMMIKRSASDNPNQDMFPALGLVIEQKSGKVFIADVFPNANQEMAKDDVIKSLNGKEVKDLKEFNGVFEKVEIGSELKFELARGEKVVTVTMKRPKPQGGMMIKQ